MSDEQMDDLLNSLASTTRISLEDDDVSLIHPRYDQYKPKKTLNQEERRRRWLLAQKQKRLDCFILNRSIENAENYSSEDEGEAMITGGAQVERKHKQKILKYKNCLMLSYWLVEVPEDFATNWYFMLCPQGKRAIVVASKGRTIAYSRKGAFLMKFPSALPGGNSECFGGYTVLDCVFSYTTQTYYVLDVLEWTIPLTDCSAEMRYFWLSNKFAENPDLMKPSSQNRHKFQILNHELVESLHKSMSVHPVFEKNDPKVDGVLFIQKESFYTGGKTPLAVWLKPFMVRDILNIPVHENYNQEIPPQYTSKPSKMETESCAPETEPLPK